MARPITVAWISDFAFEWLPDLPDSLSRLPKPHPMTWQVVLLNELRTEDSVKLHIIALRKNIAQDVSFEQEGVVFHLLKTRGATRVPSLFWTDTFLIRKKLAQIRPHLVHAWGTERGAALVASRLPYPYLVTIQGLMGWYQELIPMTLHDRISAFFERISLPRAPMVSTESIFAEHYLHQHFSKLKVARIEHAPNWLFHRIQRKPQISPLRLIFVGSFDFRKGADLLLRALDRLRPEQDFELVVVGFAPPELRAQFSAVVSEKLWEKISFRQGLLPSQIAQEFAVATMLILPTRADTSPNAVKEAVVAGVPVVASRIGGIPDYVFPDRNGLLFSSENLDELISTLKTAFRHPLFSKGLVTGESLEQTRADLSPQLMGKKFHQAYRELTNSAQL